MGATIQCMHENNYQNRPFWLARFLKTHNCNILREA